MPREKRAPSKPSQAYLVSFGDTMTALLAFFIVLNSLAEEQTGANLHTGTGSFVSAVQGLGVPGWFKENRSKTPMPADHSKPIYYVDDEGNATEKGTGPDEDDNGLAVQDREREQVQRLVNELDNLFPTVVSATRINEIVFDSFESIGKTPNYLGTDVKKILIKCLPFIDRPAYEVDIIVWTPTPSSSAWTRSVLTAGNIDEQIRMDFRLNSKQATNLRCVARAWHSSTEKRPTISIRVSKIEAK